MTETIPPSLQTLTPCHKNVPCPQTHTGQRLGFTLFGILGKSSLFLDHILTHDRANPPWVPQNRIQYSCSTEQLHVWSTLVFVKNMLHIPAPDFKNLFPIRFAFIYTSHCPIFSLLVCSEQYTRKAAGLLSSPKIFDLCQKQPSNMKVEIPSPSALGEQKGSIL